VLNNLKKWDPKIVAVDGNLSPETLEAIVTHCHIKETPGSIELIAFSP
jgi:hypothetical protein